MLKTKTEPECHLSATPSMNPYSNNLSPLPSYCPFTLGWFSHSVSHCLIWIYSSRCSFLSLAKVRHLPKLISPWIFAGHFCTIPRCCRPYQCTSPDGSAPTLHLHCPAHLPHLVVQLLSHVQFFATPLTSHWAFLSMRFSRQEYWSGDVISFSRESSWPRDQTCIPCISQ